MAESSQQVGTDMWPGVQSAWSPFSIEGEQRRGRKSSQQGVLSVGSEQGCGYEVQLKGSPVGRE